MKVAVVGCGGMGSIHAHSYAKMPAVKLVGVCDIRMEMAEELAGETGTTAFGSLEAMITAVDPDVVSITLPSYLHKDYVCKAADFGKHIICEKPLALTSNDAEEISRYCEHKGVQLYVGHVVRFFPEYVRMKQEIDAGRVGRVGVAHARRVGEHPGNKSLWFKEMEKSGGVILDLMVHDIDYMRWTLGEVKSVYCLNHRDEKMDYALVTLVFHNGTIANLEGFWGYPGSFRTSAEFAGSKGIIQNDSMASQSLHIRKASVNFDRSKFAEVPQSPGYKSPYDLELAHFLACIQEQQEPRVTAKDACQAVRIAEAALESARTGNVVML
ncbi:oxidoreductase [Paenibacillus swuensis]|uniref:Oxidoreductase n=1 Tax=Paenibacillus swuensis TaxID=1178515 RepID=A0A172TE87_9BACL|nr:Gfo/Idh/MocA family oxidoreductase [Paenibacillus swuensis]ANE45320.1 oxidoreductase [Paenibacillus swuensis]